MTAADAGPILERRVRHRNLGIRSAAPPPKKPTRNRGPVVRLAPRGRRSSRPSISSLYESKCSLPSTRDAANAPSPRSPQRPRGEENFPPPGSRLQKSLRHKPKLNINTPPYEQ